MGWQPTSSEGVGSRGSKAGGHGGPAGIVNRTPFAIKKSTNCHHEGAEKGVLRTRVLLSATCESLSLVFLGLFLGSIFLALTIFVLDILVVDVHGLVDLSAQS